MHVLSDTCPPAAAALAVWSPTWPFPAPARAVMGGLSESLSGYDAAAVHAHNMPPEHARGDLDRLAPVALESTLDLLARAQSGESTALDALFERCLPPLRRWARGRLPRYARNMSDTQDLVQDTVLHALHRLDAFEARHAGALQAYLRQAVTNRIRDAIRRATRHPAETGLSESHLDLAPSPLEHAIGREGLEHYEEALARLRALDREAIIARFELQQSYEEIASALGKPSADAARVAVTRALARLVEEMGDEG